MWPASLESAGVFLYAEILLCCLRAAYYWCASHWQLLSSSSWMFPNCYSFSSFPSYFKICFRILAWFCSFFSIACCLRNVPAVRTLTTESDSILSFVAPLHFFMFLFPSADMIHHLFTMTSDERKSICVPRNNHQPCCADGPSSPFCKSAVRRSLVVLAMPEWLLPVRLCSGVCLSTFDLLVFRVWPLRPWRNSSCTDDGRILCFQLNFVAWRSPLSVREPWPW